MRVALAVAGTAIASWYDLANNRNVPNNFLYGFLAVAILANAVFFQQDVVVFAAATAALIFAAGYVLYKVGYIGGADVYVLTSIALLVPVFPSHVDALFNFPVVLSILINSGVLFAAYSLYLIISHAVLNGKKGKYEYFLLAPAYGVLLYFLSSTGVFGIGYLAAITLLIFSSILFMVYRESVTAAMARKVPLSKVEEEDVAVLELMPALAKKYKIKRLLDEKELARLRKLDVKWLYVYKELPPFLPFVLAGLLIAVTLGDLLMNSLKI